MKSPKHYRTWNTKAVARTAAVLVLAVLMIGMALTPVLADGHRKHYKGKRYHGPRHYHGPRAYYYPAAPVYVAPPPAVVYAPPPPPPGISVVFPITIR